MRRGLGWQNLGTGAWAPRVWKKVLGWGAERGLRKGMRLEKEARNGKDQGIKEACRGEGSG